MKFFFLFFFLAPVVFLHAQVNDVKKTETLILAAYMKKDTQNLKKYIDPDFILVYGDGRLQGRKEFVNSNLFQLADSFYTSTQHQKIVNRNDLVILSGVSINQWKEGGRTIRSKIPYTDTYKKINGSWQLISSYVNDGGEDYFELKDTTGVWAAIAKQYQLLDRSVEQKDLCTNLGLKSSGFSTIDQNGVRLSAQFMRQRSKFIFDAMRDSIQARDEIESLAFAGDTAKVVVHQSFKRNQFMAGKVRRVETSARQRESWMLTREGWKLVFVDQVKPLTRIVDGKATDPTKPFNPNDPAFNK
ncbi:MAG TPA: nuclear transport factor 2 family protein [Chitinophagaceae bacterium]|jgi:hypothetical protein|nr:nuclear transport factor 2 family protein [Chitinophagaceae bacterium]